MLLTIENIENKLIEKFSPFQGEMDDLILKKRTSLPSNIDALEKELEVNIDGEFLSFISKYELDNFSLGNIAFGVGSDYINTLIKLNKKNNFNHWWQGDDRPAEFILIAISDPYTILLNTVNGKIYAITSESEIKNDEEVSSGFNVFVRGVGSLFLKTSTPSEICSLVNARNKEFWHEI